MHIHHVIYRCQATIEHRKLAVDLAEVVIKWEVQRVKDDQESTEVRIHKQLKLLPVENELLMKNYFYYYGFSSLEVYITWPSI